MPTALFVPATPLERRLTAALWSFTSSYWRGFVDFREPGHYWTHWGFGTWRSLGDRRITMRNSYDPFYFTLEFDDSLERFECIDSNHHTRPSGLALYAYARDEVLAPTTAPDPVRVVKVRDEAERGGPERAALPSARAVRALLRR